MKVCNKCGLEKENTSRFFEFQSSNKNKLRNTCKICRNKQRKPENLKLKYERYRIKHKDEISEYNRVYHSTYRYCSYCKNTNKTRLFSNAKTICDVCFIKDKKRRRNTRVRVVNETVDRKCIYCESLKTSNNYQYRKTICDDCYRVDKRAKDSRNLKRRLKTDPAYKLRVYFSNAIGRALRHNGGSKFGESVMKYLPYTIEELRLHIEKQWESWMNWSNHGSPRLNERKWHIDHVKPKAMFKYDSFVHPDFLACWNLSNLRPMEAFANMKKLDKIMQDYL